MDEQTKQDAINALAHLRDMTRMTSANFFEHQKAENEVSFLATLLEQLDERLQQQDGEISELLHYSNEHKEKISGYYDEVARLKHRISELDTEQGMVEYLETVPCAGLGDEKCPRVEALKAELKTQ